MVAVKIALGGGGDKNVTKKLADVFERAAELKFEVNEALADGGLGAGEESRVMAVRGDEEGGLDHFFGKSTRPGGPHLLLPLLKELRLTKGGRRRRLLLLDEDAWALGGGGGRHGGRNEEGEKHEAEV